MKFLVVGDIMIDRYLIGEVDRISPEAPVPIVDVKFQYDVLGGAANCARNISTITGKDTVDIAGHFNPSDEAGKEVEKLLKKEGIYFWLMGINTYKPTTLKERIFSGNQQLLRIDIENKEEIFFDNKPEHPFFIKLKPEQYDYIIVSDYAKGVVTKSVMEWLAPYANKMIIDPKPENWALYPSGVLLMTPNESENRQMRFVQPELPQHILVTKGKKGMTLHTDQWSKDIESKDVPNCEVIGAGDTVSATMAISLSRGVDIVRAAKISNACAGYVVSQPSTAVVPKEVYEDIFIKESL